MRYNRGSVSDTVQAAIAQHADKNLYVYPTAYGMVIDRQAPPFGLQHIVVKPDGTTEVKKWLEDYIKRV